MGICFDGLQKTEGSILFLRKGKEGVGVTKYGRGERKEGIGTKTLKEEI